jgi:hypothetical protein
VADIPQALSFYGFNAKGAERRSFVRAGASSTRRSSATTRRRRRGLGRRRHAARRVPLVDTGMSVGLTHDRRTAASR